MCDWITPSEVAGKLGVSESLVESALESIIWTTGNEDFCQQHYQRDRSMSRTGYMMVLLMIAPVLTLSQRMLAFKDCLSIDEVEEVG